MQFSFEIFPPRTPSARAALRSEMVRMAALGPEFVSITCGAGGDGNTQNAEIVADARAAGFAVVPHLTCAGADRRSVLDAAQGHLTQGVAGILALRGDGVGHPEGFEDVLSLIRAIGTPTDAKIYCAAYPDPHPESRGAETDLDWLARKAEAGAKEAITQYAFDADTILRFRDAASVATPGLTIRPGILPVRDVAALLRFSARCGARVPPFVLAALRHHPAGSDDFLSASADLTARLIEDLRAGGIPAVHLYALNDAALTERIAERTVLTSTRDRGILAA